MHILSIDVNLEFLFDSILLKKARSLSSMAQEDIEFKNGSSDMGLGKSSVQYPFGNEVSLSWAQGRIAVVGSVMIKLWPLGKGLIKYVPLTLGTLVVIGISYLIMHLLVPQWILLFELVFYPHHHTHLFFVYSITRFTSFTQTQLAAWSSHRRDEQWNRIYIGGFSVPFFPELGYKVQSHYWRCVKIGCTEEKWWIMHLDHSSLIQFHALITIIHTVSIKFDEVHGITGR